jgi:UDP-GlcNAc:undecaprenyl-phosphate GlcNAc-1-phosphate transferase
MTALLAMMTALVISIALTPLMIRLAPRMGMVDLPDPRKVHLAPIPRVGGLGIAVGTLVALLLFVPIDSLVAWYLFGAAVLLLFGAADDAMELGHWVKFVGQFIAVIPIVMSTRLKIDPLVSQFFGGTSLLITVGVLLDTMRQMESYLLMRHYDGFLKKGRVRGRS